MQGVIGPWQLTKSEAVDTHFNINRKHLVRRNCNIKKQKVYLMSPKEKFLLGGAGALVPVLMTIGVADIDKIDEYLREDHYKLLGYALRGVALFLLGAIWVYADRSITTRRKAVEIGLLGPALISAWLNAMNVAYERDDGSSTSISSVLISNAYAQSSNSGGSQEQERGEPSPVDRIIKGARGR